MCVLHVVHLDIHVHVYSTTFRHADMCICTCIVSESMYYILSMLLYLHVYVHVYNIF